MLEKLSEFTSETASLGREKLNLFFGANFVVQVIFEMMLRSKPFIADGTFEERSSQVLNGNVPLQSFPRFEKKFAVIASHFL